ncbi:MAG: glycosyltransferase, partial [Holophagales bacterium]|nr:glycosyltransferase [Holophagales bacterium]
MKVVILAAGTRGDIDPFLALALGMKAAGHGVMVWVPPTFEPKVRRLGLRTAPPQANADPFEPLRPTKGDLLGAHLRGELHVLHQMMAAHWNACRGADLVVY